MLVVDNKHVQAPLSVRTLRRMHSKCTEADEDRLSRYRETERNLLADKPGFLPAAGEITRYLGPTKPY